MYDSQKLEELRRALERWDKTTLQQSLARLPERRRQYITTSSEPIERLYTPLDVAGMDYLEDLGLARRISLHAWCASHPASRQAVDDAHVRWLWHR